MGNLANIGMALGIGATILAGSVAGVAINDNKQLENDNKQLVVEVESAKEENSQLLDTKKLQETMIESLKTEKATLQTQVDTITSEKGELNTQLATEQEKYNTLVAEKTELTNTYNALVESNNLTLEEKAELETQIVEKQNQIDEQLINITALNSTIAERDATILSLQSQISEISKQIDGVIVTFDSSYLSLDVCFDTILSDGSCVNEYRNFYALEGNYHSNGSFYGSNIRDRILDSNPVVSLTCVEKHLCYIFALPEFGSSTNVSLFIGRIPVVNSNVDCNIQVTYNGGEYSENLILDEMVYILHCKVNFEYNENNEIVSAILYQDIRPVEVSD